jgi:hypothetical protein
MTPRRQGTNAAPVTTGEQRSPATNATVLAYRSRAAWTALVRRARVSSSRQPTLSPIHAR